MEINSPAFQHQGIIPKPYTCEGRNISPSLHWTGVPDRTRSLALIVDDPDAPGGTWLHWLLYDLPPTVTALPEDQPCSQFLPSRARQGLNDFRHLGYGGPCPPAGNPHRYFFTLYALDHAPDLKPGATRAELERAMHGHVLEQAQLMGIYQR